MAQWFVICHCGSFKKGGSIPNGTRGISGIIENNTGISVGTPEDLIGSKICNKRDIPDPGLLKMFRLEMKMERV